MNRTTLKYVSTMTKRTTGWTLVELPAWCFPKDHERHRKVFVGV